MNYEPPSMNKIKPLAIFLLIAFNVAARSQQIPRYNPDTLMTVVLDSVININAHPLRVQDFIDAVVADTSFYKAFQDMKRFSFVAENRIYTYNKKDRISGKIYRKIKHSRQGGGQRMQYLARADSGDLYKRSGKYRLYTIEMFDYVFMNAYKSGFTTGEKSNDGSKNSSYKSKLKTLIFRPGTKVRGIPFISGKTEIFSPELRQFYNYQFARGTYLDSIPVYRFKVIRKPSTAPGDVMINEMTTIFDTRTFKILGRYFDMKFKNLLFEFDVQMNIEMNTFNDVLLPVKVSYQGNWDVPLHKEERASFLILFKDYDIE